MMHFMISSGLITDIAAIPVPDFAVPYAAPSAENTMAADAPITPKNGPHTGFFGSDILMICLLSGLVEDLWFVVCGELKYHGTRQAKRKKR